VLVNRLYFQTAEYVASYDYDDALLKLVGYHVDTDVDLTLEIRQGLDDALVASRAFSAGTYDIALSVDEQVDVLVDPRGRVTNLYARTV
jgi:hypothetical protein